MDIQKLLQRSPEEVAHIWMQASLPVLLQQCSSVLDLLICFCRAMKTLHKTGWLLCLIQRTG